jgi:hypothetical protein
MSGSKGWKHRGGQLQKSNLKFSSESVESVCNFIEPPDHTKKGFRSDPKSLLLFADSRKQTVNVTSSSCCRSLSQRFFRRRFSFPAGRGLFAQTLIPVCRGPSKVEDVVLHECGQFFYPGTEHVLEALGDMLLPRTVHADALHAVPVAVAAGLYTGAIIHQCRQAFGGRRFFRATFHEVLRDYFCKL